MVDAGYAEGHILQCAEVITSRNHIIDSDISDTFSGHNQFKRKAINEVVADLTAEAHPLQDGVYYTIPLVVPIPSVGVTGGERDDRQHTGTNGKRSSHDIFSNWQINRLVDIHNIGDKERHLWPLSRVVLREASQWDSAVHLVPEVFAVSGGVKLNNTRLFRWRASNRSKHFLSSPTIMVVYDIGPVINIVFEGSCGCDMTDKVSFIDSVVNFLLPAYVSGFHASILGEKLGDPNRASRQGGIAKMQNPQVSSPALPACGGLLGVHNVLLPDQKIGL